MPAEVPSATVVLLMAFVVLLAMVPFVVLAASPFLLMKLLTSRRTPVYRRGGYYAIR